MSDFKYFTRDEFKCKETGNNDIKDAFIKKLDHLREVCGFPFVITSGYRDPSHSAERNKPRGGGTHTQGIAADIHVQDGAQRMQVVKMATALGFIGIGVSSTFVHVDTRDSTPVLWVY